MQVGSATDNGQRSQPDGCTVRTDSVGRVYVFGIAFWHGRNYEAMYRSADGGSSYAGPTLVPTVVAPGVIDPVLGRPVLHRASLVRVATSLRPPTWTSPTERRPGQTRQTRQTRS